MRKGCAGPVLSNDPNRPEAADRLPRPLQPASLRFGVWGVSRCALQPAAPPARARARPADRGAPSSSANAGKVPPALEPDTAQTHLQGASTRATRGHSIWRPVVVSQGCLRPRPRANDRVQFAVGKRALANQGTGVDRDGSLRPRPGEAATLSRNPARRPRIVAQLPRRWHAMLTRACASERAGRASTTACSPMASARPSALCKGQIGQARRSPAVGHPC